MVEAINHKKNDKLIKVFSHPKWTQESFFFVKFMCGGKSFKGSCFLMYTLHIGRAKKNNSIFIHKKQETLTSC